MDDEMETNEYAMRAIKMEEAELEFIGEGTGF